MITLAHKQKLIKSANQNSIKTFFKYVALFLIILLFNNISFSEICLPFGWVISFAFIWYGLNPISITIFQLSSLLIMLPNIYGIYLAINFFIAMVILVLCSIRKEKFMTSSVFISSIISQAACIYLSLNPRDITISLFGIGLGLITLYSAIIFLKSIKRKFTAKYNNDEILCGSILLIILAVGMTNVNFVIPINYFFITLIILFSTYINSPFSTLLISAIFGVGVSLVEGPIYIALFVILALGSIAFKSKYKIFSVISIVICNLIFNLYFSLNVYDFYPLISIFIASIIFMCIPITKFEIIKKLTCQNIKADIRNLANRNKEGICKHIENLSKVFSEMDFVFRQMVKGNIGKNDAKNMIIQELMQKTCINCSEKNNCLRINGEFTTEVFDDLVEIGLEKGRVSLLDVSQYLTSRCGKINFLINSLNQLLSSFQHYSNLIKNMDTSRILIAEQLSGVGLMLKQLSKEINQNVSFDFELESKIQEELIYKNIHCLEVIVFESSHEIKNISMLIKDQTINKKIIEKTLSSICKNKISIDSIAPSELPNISQVVAKTSPNYDMVFGVASASKNNMPFNGDTHTIIKIDNGKYLASICDGMGSGKLAEKTSMLTLSLVENFYKAGYPNEIILSSVNKLLSLNDNENFSTLDIGIFDFHKNIMDFIKLGSPECYLKHKNSTELISTSTLPIGVLDEISPKITRKVIRDFDLVVMISDGIMEAFNGNEDLKAYINNINNLNPQTIADDILSRAKVFSNNSINDDMTVLVVKTFPVAN